jgi:Sec7-like guanine-nucleotide exchange factor
MKEADMLADMLASESDFGSTGLTASPLLTLFEAGPTIFVVSPANRKNFQKKLSKKEKEKTFKHLVFYIQGSEASFLMEARGHLFAYRKVRAYGNFTPSSVLANRKAQALLPLKNWPQVY